MQASIRKKNNKFNKEKRVPGPSHNHSRSQIHVRYVHCEDQAIYGLALLILLETSKLNRVCGWAKNNDTDQAPTAKGYSKLYTFSVTPTVISLIFSLNS